MNVIIGAGSQNWDGWIATQKEEIDLIDEATWETFFGARKADAFLCEHVFEHITLEEGLGAAKRIYRYLNKDGFIRLAVPDKYFPNEAYQKIARVGGPGPKEHPAADHKVLYDYKQLVAVFEQAGFYVTLLEYHDEQHQFHINEWEIEKAPIYRSSKLDHRNQEGQIGFASLIIEATKRHLE